MAAPTIALIEAALKTELDEISGLNVYSYMGQDPDVGMGDAISFPAAFALYQGESKPEFVDGPNYRRSQKWAIVIATQSYAGSFDPAVRASTGAYAVVEAVLAKMVNWKESATLTDIGRFTPGEITRLKTSRTEAWYAMEFTVAFDQQFTAQAWGA